jgi:hypothetical protein
MRKTQGLIGKQLLNQRPACDLCKRGPPFEIALFIREILSLTQARMEVA